MFVLCVRVSMPEAPGETQQLAARSSSDPSGIGNSHCGGSSSDGSSSSESRSPDGSHCFVGAVNMCAVNVHASRSEWFTEPTINKSRVVFQSTLNKIERGLRIHVKQNLGPIDSS